MDQQKNFPHIESHCRCSPTWNNQIFHDLLERKAVGAVGFLPESHRSTALQKTPKKLRGSGATFESSSESQDEQINTLLKDPLANSGYAELVKD